MSRDALDAWQTVLTAVFLTGLTAAGVTLIAAGVIAAIAATVRAFGRRW